MSSILIRFMTITAIIASPLLARANFQFSNLTTDQVNSISEEFGANFAHSAVQGASGLGNIFGFQVGLVGGLTSSSAIDDLAKQTGSSGVSSIPHAGLMAAVTIPFGLTFEATMLPSQSTDNASLKNMSAALKWSMFDFGIIHTSLRAHYASSEFNFTQTVSSLTSNVDVDQSIAGGQLLVGASLLLVEAYGGIGVARQSSNWNITGSSIFATASQTESSSSTSSHLTAGVNVSLLFLKLGVEYNRLFDTDRYTAKLALGF